MLFRSSRQIPHLDCYFKLAVCGPNDLPTLHTWLNDERVDVFWQEKGTWEQHETFLAERTADAHVVPVIGSYVTASKEGVVEADEQATYSEVYWVKEDRLGQLLGEAKVDDYDRGTLLLNLFVVHDANRQRTQVFTCSSDRTLTAALTASGAGSRPSSTFASSTTCAPAASSPSRMRRTAR